MFCLPGKVISPEPQILKRPAGKKTKSSSASKRTKPHFRSAAMATSCPSTAMVVKVKKQKGKTKYVKKVVKMSGQKKYRLQKRQCRQMVVKNGFN